MLYPVELRGPGSRGFYSDRTSPSNPRRPPLCRLMARMRAGAAGLTARDAFVLAPMG